MTVRRERTMMNKKTQKIVLAVIAIIIALTMILALLAPMFG